MLKITRNEGETWRECAERYAKPYGLQSDVLFTYDRAVEAGISEGDAAFQACYEWDVVDFVPED